MNEAKKEAMMTAFDAFTARIASRYAQARECLDRGEYEKAQQILASLSVSHAKTSLSLRGMLIRDGLLREDN